MQRSKGNDARRRLIEEHQQQQPRQQRHLATAAPVNQMTLLHARTTAEGTPHSIPCSTKKKTRADYKGTMIQQTNSPPPRSQSRPLPRGHEHPPRRPSCSTPCAPCANRAALFGWTPGIPFLWVGRWRRRGGRGGVGFVEIIDLGDGTMACVCVGGDDGVLGMHCSYY